MNKLGEIFNIYLGICSTVKIWMLDSSQAHMLKILVPRVALLGGNRIIQM